MELEDVTKNCILAIATRISQGNPVSESQVRDFYQALSDYFSIVRESDSKTRETFVAAAIAARGVVNQFGLSPGYKFKYCSGLSDERRKERVKSDYNGARATRGIDEQMDAIWT